MPPDHSKKHYLLDPMEAELVACFRLLSEPAQNAIITVIASQCMRARQKIDRSVKLSLVDSGKSR